jgi:hypothetical protein
VLHPGRSMYLYLILPFYDPYDVTPHISFLGRLRVMDLCSIITSKSPILSSLTFVHAQKTNSAHWHDHEGLFAHKILRPAPIAPFEPLFPPIC